MRANAFKTCHPLVNLVYFVSVIGFSCVYLHPLCLGISLFAGLGWSMFLLGRTSVRKSLLVLLPMIGITALMNPLFNHQGITALWYFPSGNALTLESILYGVLAGTMVACVLVWFLCLRQIMTEEKIIYLFGRIAPALALVFSMTLRFVPRFLEQFRKVSRARQAMGRNGKPGIKVRLREAMSVFSGVTTWALENSLDTADSMKARGYGLPGRTAFSTFRLNSRDVISLLVILLLAGTVLTGGILGQMKFRCFPAIGGSGISLGNLPYFVGYFLLCSYPLLLELREVRRWNATISKG